MPMKLGFLTVLYWMQTDGFCSALNAQQYKDQ